MATVAEQTEWMARWPNAVPPQRALNEPSRQRTNLATSEMIFKRRLVLAVVLDDTSLVSINISIRIAKDDCRWLSIWSGGLWTANSALLFFLGPFLWGYHFPTWHWLKTAIVAVTLHDSMRWSFSIRLYRKLKTLTSSPRQRCQLKQATKRMVGCIWRGIFLGYAWWTAIPFILDSLTGPLAASDSSWLHALIIKSLAPRNRI